MRLARTKGIRAPGCWFYRSWTEPWLSPDSSRTRTRHRASAAVSGRRWCPTWQLRHQVTKLSRRSSVGSPLKWWTSSTPASPHRWQRHWSRSRICRRSRSHGRELRRRLTRSCTGAWVVAAGRATSSPRLPPATAPRPHRPAPSPGARQRRPWRASPRTCCPPASEPPPTPSASAGTAADGPDRRERPAADRGCAAARPTPPCRL